MITISKDLELASKIDQMHSFFPDRFRIRRSTNDGSKYCAMINEDAKSFGGALAQHYTSFICPQQVNKVSGCAACMACTYTSKNVRFINHGRTLKSAPNTTIFRKMIQPINSDKRILKNGSTNKKLKDDIVEHGAWALSKILNVSGIERFHCPKTCHHWNDCYGNGMPFAHRFQIDNSIVQDKLHTECMNLPVRKHGYAIRLHVIGDFPNERYIQTWYDIMMKREDIKVFGFTALPINVERVVW